MQRRHWLIVTIAVVLAGLVGTALMIFPAGQLIVGSDTDYPPAPEFDVHVSANDARLVLPPIAGAPATLHFEVTNHGSEMVFLRDVRLDHAETVGIYDTVGPAITPLENVDIPPGETVTFSPENRNLVASSYDSSVVPGATLRMTLVFGNSEELVVPIPVEAFPRQGAVSAAGDASG